MNIAAFTIMKSPLSVLLLDPIEEKGVKYQLKANNNGDLNRMAIASTSASIFIPEIDFEVPNLPRGVHTTV